MIDQQHQRSGTLVTVQLSVMMFLQFFLWGAWFVTLGPYMGSLGFVGSPIANAYTTAPIAAIISPLFLGILADRFLPSQIVMGVLHLLGGALLLVAPSMLAEGTSPWLFIGVLLAHMLCYMPTLGLSNTIAFKAMTRPDKQFPLVRVWGTIGWIVAGLLIALIARYLHPVQDYLAGGLTLDAYEAAKAAIADGVAVEQGVLALVEQTDGAVALARNGDPQFFYVAGASGILLGVVSFGLPHTPAPLKGKPVNVGAMLGLDTLKLMRDRSFAVFIIGSMLICIPLAAYYQQAGEFARQAGIEDVPFKMSFGQMSEIVFMLLMPLFFARLGVKWMLTVGMLAWVVRYGLFAGAWGGAGGEHVMWMILLGIILHGICYDFFFVTGQIYTEQRAPHEIRAQAQSFLVLVTQGVGMLIGMQLVGILINHYSEETPDGAVVHWDSVWLAPTIFAGVVMVGFFLLFKKQPVQPSPDDIGDEPMEGVL